MDRRFTLKPVFGMPNDLPDAGALSRALFRNVPDLALSNLLPEGFVYKPMLFEQAQLTDRAQNTAFKRIKSARLIRRELLREYRTANMLICALQNGVIVKCGDRLSAEACGPDERFDLYVSLPDAYADALRVGDERTIGGARFLVTDAETVENRGGVYTIQSAAPVTDATRIGGETESMFRAGYDRARSRLILLPGSTFIAEDDVGCPAGEERPYRYYWR